MARKSFFEIKLENEGAGSEAFQAEEIASAKVLRQNRTWDSQEMEIAPFSLMHSIVTTGEMDTGKRREEST